MGSGCWLAAKPRHLPLRVLAGGLGHGRDALGLIDFTLKMRANFAQAQDLARGGADFRAGADFIDDSRFEHRRRAAIDAGVESRAIEVEDDTAHGRRLIGPLLAKASRMAGP